MVVSVWLSCVVALWFTWDGYGGKKSKGLELHVVAVEKSEFLTHEEHRKF
jgi:hypothetical protein